MRWFVSKFNNLLLYTQTVGSAAKASKTILLTDPSLQEGFALDGRIVFAVNAHK